MKYFAGVIADFEKEGLLKITETHCALTCPRNGIARQHHGCVYESGSLLRLGSRDAGKLEGDSAAGARGS